ncbi:MAG: hypothetical protein OEU92_12050 [Alphaproteobacteria bacterium]|nr:hypothetical protein [Alphaproteobacteria bacterium]
MTNRFEQSTPPSIHDVYRGLPIGPGGVEPFIFRDRGPRTRPPARLPWQNVGTLVRRIVDLFRGTGPVAGTGLIAGIDRERSGSLATKPPAACCQHA